MGISERIKKIYSLCEGDFIWDICCDHSLVAILNFQNKKFKKVYCIDKSPNSIEKTLAHFRKLEDNKIYTPINYEDSMIDIRCLDGTLLDWSEVSGSVVIAGVGTHTALEILRSCPENLRKNLTWILNPFNYLDLFRKELKTIFNPENSTIDEFSVIENGRERVLFKISLPQCRQSKIDKAHLVPCD